MLQDADHLGAVAVLVVGYHTYSTQRLPWVMVAPESTMPLLSLPTKSLDTTSGELV